ncbi:polysaccharide deacetylase family protein [Muriicola sp.]|uniref:polysaccharide deacetylase family protein n=1 Tax=Muriicola sp. TaxID=2020856 RepID=UPI003C72E839
MLLIYTHKITPRFTYIMKQIFLRILGIEVGFTTKVEDFIKHSGPKITYTKQPLQNEFFIRSHPLLFEHGINDLQITMSEWGDTPCFFPTGERSNVPYDIFAASFYLLSRYEEYVPHVKDLFGRFPYKESMAHQHGFLQQPVVDLWAQKLVHLLKERFPTLEQKPKSVRFTSIIDVTVSHSFAHRGLFRGSVGVFLDLIGLKFRKVMQRLLVLSKFRKDPYDNFSELIALHKKHGVSSMFFFQYARYSRYDKNISTENNAFKHLIKSVADYNSVSLAASYSSFSNMDLLKLEKENLTNVINKAVTYVRLRYNRVDIPETYRNLVGAEFTDDFSMGFTHETGFKAGTCTSFYFYDIPLEIQQPIKIHPFAMHDYALLKYESEEEIFKELDQLYEQVKQVNGHFMTVFSNELLGSEQKLNWIELYDKIVARYHV